MFYDFINFLSEVGELLSNFSGVVWGRGWKDVCSFFEYARTRSASLLDLIILVSMDKEFYLYSTM